MYLQVFFFGPLHKKSRRVNITPPDIVRFVDANKNEYLYRLQFSTGEKYIYAWHEDDGENL